ncbi:MAG: tetratricopeptide repeat protein [Chitinophagaceae bacterium]|nr:MAG: tetratricopeptide repeat protein [Chitinophagaceae bacterium]
MYFYSTVKTTAVRNILLGLLLFVAGGLRAQEAKGVSAPAPNSAAKGKIYALIVGVADYQNLPRLSYSPADARALADYLVQVQRLPASQVFCYVNEEASRINIVDRLYAIADELKPGDQFLFYFSGHGDWESKLSDNALLLLNRAPNKNYLRYPDQYLDCNLLNEFLRRLSEQQVKTLLIADACHSGNLSGGRNGVENTALQLKQGWKNVVRILSCMPDEFSYEDARWGGGRGVFSYYLTEGLKGLVRKDANAPFDLTIGELRSYLEDNLNRETGGKQTPLFEGDPRFVVARVEKGAKPSRAHLVAAAPRGGAPVTKGAVDTSSSEFRALTVQFGEAIDRRELTAPAAASAFGLYRQLLRLAPEDYLEGYRLRLLAAVQSHYRTYLDGFYKEQGFPEEELQMLRTELEAARNSCSRRKALRDQFESERLFIEACLVTYAAQHGGAQQLPASELQRAATLLDSALKLTPWEPSLYRKLGDCYIEMSPAKAIAALDRLVALLPRDGAAYNALGVAHFGLGQYDEAIRALQTATRLSPDASNYYYNLGRCYEKKGLQGEANLYFKKAQTRNQPEPRENDYQ